MQDSSSASTRGDAADSQTESTIQDKIVETSGLHVKGLVSAAGGLHFCFIAAVTDEGSMFSRIP